jgi:cell wall-associated NlpC family hydrolase
VSYEPRFGDFGVVKTGGIAALLIRVGTSSRWNHAFICIGDDLIVEANPTGVEISPVSKYPLIGWNCHQTLTAKQRQVIVSLAMETVGKPYSFLTIFNIILRIIGLKMLADTKIMKKLALKTGYICSELVEECYRKAGVPLIKKEDFKVTPGDLAEVLVYQ